MERNCPPIVATPAPATPSSGNGPIPKINNGSKMILETPPMMPQIIGTIILPVACRIFSDVICTIQNSEPIVMIRI